MDQPKEDLTTAILTRCFFILLSGVSKAKELASHNMWFPRKIYQWVSTSEGKFCNKTKLKQEYKTKH